MNNYERYLSNAKDAAAFLSSVTTCETCPVERNDKFGSYAGCSGEGTCEESLLVWLMREQHSLFESYRQERVNKNEAKRKKWLKKVRSGK